MLKQGNRFPVSMTDAFPQGCYLLPDSICEAQDYDEKTKTRRGTVDKVTGKRVYQCRVVDMDSQLEGRSREMLIKIAADRMPVPPTGGPFEPVSFENLTATPYVSDKGKLACSLRATAIKAVRVMKDAAA